MKNDAAQEDTTPEQNELQSRRDDASVQRHPKEDRESLGKARKGKGQDEFAPRDVYPGGGNTTEIRKLHTFSPNYPVWKEDGYACIKKDHSLQCPGPGDTEIRTYSRRYQLNGRRERNNLRQ